MYSVDGWEVSHQACRLIFLRHARFGEAAISAKLVLTLRADVGGHIGKIILNIAMWIRMRILLLCFSLHALAGGRSRW